MKRRMTRTLRCQTWLWKTHNSLKYSQETCRLAAWEWWQISRSKWPPRWTTKKSKCWHSSKRPKSYAKIWKGSSLVMWSPGGIEHRSWSFLKKTMGPLSTCGLSAAFSVRCWVWWKNQLQPTSIASHFFPENLASHYHQIELLEFRPMDSPLLRMTSLQWFLKFLEHQTKTTSHSQQTKRQSTTSKVSLRSDVVTSEKNTQVPVKSQLISWTKCSK